MPKENSRAATLTGLALAGTGVAHFVAPQLFESITEPAFPRNTRNFIYLNGGIETALGLGLAAQKTRKAALVGLVGYAAYLATNSVRNR
ncbi:hypothetical protein [Mycobacterium deserti]|uniref:DoxX family membrane protein n=1 Tax=Mycobacterium deserti TaxID=2978347 RepID=A0ABT2M8P5_9MYCO|nr:hypothetical protein [Mycobacterium deserti]MCT7658638.1 hypothetical protein [Mycobacterium deserti]